MIDVLLHLGLGLSGFRVSLGRSRDLLLCFVENVAAGLSLRRLSAVACTVAPEVCGVPASVTSDACEGTGVEADALPVTPEACGVSASVTSGACKGTSLSLCSPPPTM